jgi:hypothetical protein
MAWPRIFLALMFAIASVVATVAPHSAQASLNESGMEMNMAAMADKMTTKDCKPCTKAGSAIPECVSAACGLAGLAVPVGARFNLVYMSAAFGRPPDQEVDSPVYSPDPYPPKSRFFI